jgi:sugar lactone lactonase YvrE
MPPVTPAGKASARARLGALLVALAASPAAADLVLPPGFTAQTYVTGQGFDPATEQGSPGIPATATLAFDRAGTLYLAKTGARFRSGEVEDFAPIYRIAAGGARLTREHEARYLHGPPLSNPQVAAVGPRGEVFVTTYDRDRRLGALYRMIDGRPTLFAGGTPVDGGEPLLRHPEGAALDPTGHVYVADRDHGAVVRLDPKGKVVDPRHLQVVRPRMLAVDEEGRLWVAGDGTAETPVQTGAGQIWRTDADGRLALVLEGPLPAGLALSPGGTPFVAQRRTPSVFAVSRHGKRVDVIRAKEGTFFRGLAFAPVTPETRRAGIAGNLFLIVVRRQIWTINEVIRITGPFDDFVRREAGTPSP